MIDTEEVASHGERLAAYAESLLQPGQSMRAFCRERGLDNALISVWKQGRKDVDVDSMRRFGDALGLTLGEVLVVAGYGTPDDFGGARPPKPEPAPLPDIDDAIARDPQLSDRERELLRNVRAFARAAGSQEVDTMTVRASTRKPRTPRRK